MDVVKKIVFTVVAVILLGIIVTAFYEKGGVDPGDGAISFVLFIAFVVIVVLIWRSKSPKSDETNK